MAPPPTARAATAAADGKAGANELSPEVVTIIRNLQAQGSRYHFDVNQPPTRHYMDIHNIFTQVRAGAARTPPGAYRPHRPTVPALDGVGAHFVRQQAQTYDKEGEYRRAYLLYWRCAEYGPATATHGGARGAGG